MKILPMKIILNKKVSLKRPPTDICAIFGNLYVSTKGKRVYFIKKDSKQMKSILFSSQVNSLETSSSTLFCSCKDGKVFGLSDTHKILYRAMSDEKGSTKCIFNDKNKELYVATYNKKISVLSEDGILKKMLYCHETPVIDIKLSFDSYIAAISQNNKNLIIFDNYETKPKYIKILYGFPEVLLYHDNYLIVGTDNGNLLIFSSKTHKKLNFTDLKSSIHSLFIYDNNTILVGTGNCKIILCDLESLKVLDEISCDGIAIGFCKYENEIVAALSRESRLGRWKKNKNSHNSLKFLQIIKK